MCWRPSISPSTVERRARGRIFLSRRNDAGAAEATGWLDAAMSPRSTSPKSVGRVECTGDVFVVAAHLGVPERLHPLDQELRGLGL
jgi:hypothetical protein